MVAHIDVLTPTRYVVDPMVNETLAVEQDRNANPSRINLGKQGIGLLNGTASGHCLGVMVMTPMTSGWEKPVTMRNIP
jgi:hypothetical protein